MISKKIVHDAVAFHNTWIKDNHVIATVQIFCGRFISVRFTYWTLKDDDSLDNILFSVDKSIYTKQDFDDYVKQVNNSLNKL